MESGILESEMKLSEDFKLLWSSESGGQPGVSAIHGGNAGDVVYSLPTTRVLGVDHYILNVCDIDPERRLTRETAQALVPLLLVQPGIKQVSIVANSIPLEKVEKIEGITHILDRFRLREAKQKSIPHCHARAFGFELDLSDVWLRINKAPQRQKHLVLALTRRYRAFGLQYWHQLLHGIGPILFLGLPAEYECAAGLNAKCYTCRDLLEMARVIFGAAVFLGNQSLGFAIAEGLKVPRLLERFPAIPNVQPDRPWGYVLSPDVSESRTLLERLLSREQETAANPQSDQGQPQ